MSKSPIDAYTPINTISVVMEMAGSARIELAQADLEFASLP